MRLVIGLLVVSAAACGGGDDGYPVGGNQDGSVVFPDTGGSGASDGGADAVIGPDGSVLTADALAVDGRVCLLTDARMLNVCASSGAAGLTVRLGEATALTNDDGTFTIEGQSGAGLVFRVSGPNIVPSYEVLADYFLPAMPQAMFNSMLSTNGVMQVQGEGSVMVFASSNAQGVPGKTATSTPLAFYDPFYDGASSAAWTQTQTGSNGAVWIPGLDVGNATVTVGSVSAQVPVFDGGITFANVLL